MGLAAYSQSFSGKAITVNCKVSEGPILSSGAFQPDSNVSSITLIQVAAPHELPNAQPLSPIDLRNKYELKKFSGMPSGKNAPDAPVLNQVFLGQPGSVQYSPNDNYLAVSNNGLIVSCINSSMFVYDSTGMNIKKRGFSSLIPAAGLPIGGFFYDPRIIYLPKHDRFALAVLYGQDPITSRLMVCISKTADPGGAWNFFAIPGGLGNNNLWMDYPQMGQSAEEIFVTGNLFQSNGDFGEAVILQININSLVAGSIRYKTWTSIDGSPFSICPAPATRVSDLSGDMRFIYSEGSEGSHLYMMQINTPQDQSPSLSRNAVAVAPYKKPLPAFQKSSTDILDQGDCRIRQAYYKDGLIHAVYTSSGSGGNGQIIYTMIDPEQLLFLTNTLSDPMADLAFPSLAPASSNKNNKKTLIYFLASGKGIFPESRMVIADDIPQFSEPIIVKTGEGYMDVGSSSTERWGDYTGLVKTFEDYRVSIWSSGSFGTNTNTSGTVIAHYLDPTDSIAPFADAFQFELFPNPAGEKVNIKIGIPYSGQLELLIFRSDGAYMGTVWKQTLLKSYHEIHEISLNEWASGLYMICIRNNEKILGLKKLMLLRP